VHIFLYILLPIYGHFSSCVGSDLFGRTPFASATHLIMKKVILDHAVHSHWSYMVEQKDSMQITSPSSKLPSTPVTAGQYCKFNDMYQQSTSNEDAKRHTCGQLLPPLSKPSMHLLQ
jgi:hypothetical protein